MHLIIHINIKYMCQCINKKSLRCQMIIYYTLSYGIFLTIMVLICIGVVTFTNVFTYVSAYTALNDQTKKNVINIMNSGSNLYAKILDNAGEGFVKIFANAMSDTYRMNYSMGYTDSYFEYGDAYLDKPLIQDERQSKPISLSHSHYYVPNSDPTDIPYFTDSLNNTRDISAHVDPYFTSLYNSYDDFVAAYIGFEEQGLFRHYPGIGTLDTDPTRSYDPRIRGWYTSTQNDYNTTNNDNKILYSEPYQDFNGKGWMITISKSIFKGETQEFVGVAGTDMLIDIIKNNINSMKILDGGKITLFETSGTVIADNEWAMDKNDPTLYTYSHLRNPPVTDDLWNNIVSSTDSNERIIDYTIDGNDWLIVASNLDGFGNKYLFIAFVPKNEITEPIDNISLTMIYTSVFSSVGLILLFITVSLFVLIGVILIARCITKPLTEINKNINQMVSNIGANDITKGLTDVRGGIGTEENKLTTGYNSMVYYLRQAQLNAGIEDNIYHGTCLFTQQPTTEKSDEIYPIVPEYEVVHNDIVVYDTDDSDGDISSDA